MIAQRKAQSAPGPRVQKEKKQAVEKLRGRSKNTEKKLAATEREIAAVEEKLAALEQEILAAASDFEKLQQIMEEQAAWQKKLEELYEEWGALSEV